MNERKAELEKLANNFLHQHNHFKKGKPQNCDARCLTEMLQAIEKEVLTRVEDYYRCHIHNDLEDWPDEFAIWTREQLREVK